MARPKMKFKPEKAVELIREIGSKIDDYEFCSRALVKAPDSHHPESHDAKKALEPLIELADKARHWKPNFKPFPEEGCELLRQWLEAYVTPQGWQRTLAAMRQRKASKKKHSGSYDNRETTVAMQAHPSYELGELAKELGLDKKELLSRLPGWFMWDEKGKAAFQAFGTTVRIEQQASGLKLLEDVFPLAAHRVRLIVFEAAGLVPVRERELHQFAFLAGKARLTKLTKVLKALPVDEQLKKLVTEKHQEKLILELAATGGMTAVLQALGASGEEDPLVAGVAAVEQALQSDSVAAIAKGLEALVPKDADFGKFKAPVANN